LEKNTEKTVEYIKKLSEQGNSKSIEELKQLLDR